MAVCNQCGASVSNASKFCPACGNTLSAPASSGDPKAERKIDVETASFEGMIMRQDEDTDSQYKFMPRYQLRPEERDEHGYEPPKPQYPRRAERSAYEARSSGGDSVMSTWSFLSSIVVFSIPVIGWGICAICAFGGAVNNNKRNFARAMLILFALTALSLVGMYHTTKWAVQEVIGIGNSDGGLLGLQRFLEAALSYVNERISSF